MWFGAWSAKRLPPDDEEVTGAIIASRWCCSACFIPVAFIRHHRQVYQQFAVTMWSQYSQRSTQWPQPCDLCDDVEPAEMHRRGPFGWFSAAEPVVAVIALAFLARRLALSALLLISTILLTWVVKQTLTSFLPDEIRAWCLQTCGCPGWIKTADRSRTKSPPSRVAYQAWVRSSHCLA